MHSILGTSGWVCQAFCHSGYPFGGASYPATHLPLPVHPPPVFVVDHYHTLQLKWPKLGQDCHLHMCTFVYYYLYVRVETTDAYGTVFPPLRTAQTAPRLILGQKNGYFWGRKWPWFGLDMGENGFSKCLPRPLGVVACFHPTLGRLGH